MRDPLAPPRLATRLLRRCLPGPRGGEISDDLAELFALKHDQHGRLRARLRYWLDVLSICARRHLHERPSHPTAPGFIMWKNYWATARRHALRHKGYTLVNLVGLAAGLAVCLLIALYLQDERRYDRFHEHADQTYHVVRHTPTEGADATINYSAANVLRADYPEVAAATRLFRHWEQPLLAQGATGFVEPAFFFADSSFFAVFSGFELLRGDPATALATPYAIVLTEAAAQKYFGNRDPIGQTLQYNGSHTFTVTGILAEIPATSHIRPDFVASLATLPQVVFDRVFEAWGVFHTYVVLHPDANPARLAAAYTEATFQQPGRRSPTTVTLLPLTDVRHATHLGNPLGPTVAPGYLQLLGGLGLLILLIACINYMNLATARSMQRAREVGLRKVVGARRGQLLGQFFAEAVLLAGAAFVLALALAYVLLPVVNELTDKALALTVPFVLLGAALAVGVGLLAGSYPALHLARFQPVQVLKGTFQASSSGKLLRRTLVVAQFAASVMLLVGALGIYQQLAYVQHADLGFDQAHVVVVPVQGQALRMQAATFRAVWEQQPAVARVGITGSAYPGKTHSPGHRLRRVGQAEEEAYVSAYRNWVDAGYLETLDVSLVAGRMFAADHAADGQTVVLNETAVRVLGWPSPEAALGETVLLSDGEHTLVGVVADFNFASLHHTIAPLALTPTTFPTNFLIRVRPGGLPETVATLRTGWQQVAADQPFTYTFLDQRVQALYEADQRWGQVIGYATLLALLVACLGLFGLAAFTAEQRTKEIGVRKVLGATVPGVMVLLAKEFLLLVGVAFLLAVPLGYAAMQRWLAGFAYHAEPGLGLFLIAAVLVGAIACLTVSTQALRVALTNPVEALRHE